MSNCKLFLFTGWRMYDLVGLTKQQKHITATPTALQTIVSFQKLLGEFVAYFSIFSDVLVGCGAVDKTNHRLDEMQQLYLFMYWVFCSTKGVINGAQAHRKGDGVRNESRETEWKKNPINTNCDKCCFLTVLWFLRRQCMFCGGALLCFFKVLNSKPAGGGLMGWWESFQDVNIPVF